MDVDIAPVVIDLGYERGEPPTYRSPSRATVPSWFPIALLSALIMIFATASAAPPKSPLSVVFRLPVGPADGYALTGTGGLLAQSFGLLSSYDLATGRVRWQAGQSMPSYRLRTTDGLVLMRPLGIGDGDPGTTAVSVATGASRWQRAGNVITVAGSTALLAVSDMRSYSGIGRRVRGTVAAVDPLTGATDWTVPVPNTAVLLGVPGPGDEGGRMLLVRDDRTATLHDLGDGRVLATAELPAADYGPDNPTVAGGLILLRHPGAQSAELSAYDPVTLKQVWTVPAAGSLGVEACGDIACLTGSGGLRGLDPDTGDVLWSRPGWQTIEQQGDLFVAYGGSDGNDPIGVVDPASGAVQVRLDGWRPVSGSGGGNELLVTRVDDTGARTMVAVARPGDAQPLLLAQLPVGTGDCQAAPDRLVCRSMAGELVVWAYRSKG
jgi:outer membrane protein assembly factor BamB